ncbi:hypothetical protein HMPREF0239_03628 [Clostridium sp. ATCC BAA-442]|nr:hypothetical protein HMPREF0239_03628 [Clostridium sp. ATCC BAA-442]
MSDKRYSFPRRLTIEPIASRFAHHYPIVSIEPTDVWFYILDIVYSYFRHSC